ncbi:MAG: hypothetical protein HY858_15850 [Candidatus Solibacter usitatus]|nr:hypothetical protein [Candidatus Solibacter usitatus]
MPVHATRLERKMRGGAQAHLLAGDDGNFYVTKFFDNPQHRRILANEWTAAVLLRSLQISAPDVRIISLSGEFLAAESGVCYQLGPGRAPVSPGWHFGSAFPGNPHTDAVYDYLPDTLLASVVNLPDFLGALVFDKWTANSDSRQAIFFRRRIRQWLNMPGAEPNRKGFIAQMVDHGYVFDGPHWTFNDSPLQGLYFRPLVYEPVRSLDDFQPWLDRACHCSPSAGDEILRLMPPDWISGEEAEFERLIERLFERRRRIPDLLLATVRARPHLFPNWR